MLVQRLAVTAIRGLVQPIIKRGLARWPDPVAAVALGYAVSSAVLIAAALFRNGGVALKIDRCGARWFAAVGLCNGLTVLALYAALGGGPVKLVSPLVASYPLVTLALSVVFLKQ